MYCRRCSYAIHGVGGIAQRKQLHDLTMRTFEAAGDGPAAITPGAGAGGTVPPSYVSGALVTVVGAPAEPTVMPPTQATAPQSSSVNVDGKAVFGTATVPSFTIV